MVLRRFLFRWFGRGGWIGGREEKQEGTKCSRMRRGDHEIRRKRGGTAQRYPREDRGFNQRRPRELRAKATAPRQHYTAWAPTLGPLHPSPRGLLQGAPKGRARRKIQGPQAFRCDALPRRRLRVGFGFLSVTLGITWADAGLGVTRWLACICKGEARVLFGRCSSWSQRRVLEGRSL